ncbi:MAG: hypothetical protein ACFE9C_03350 [Candidatus Hodarchaeota archaeon]
MISLNPINKFKTFKYDAAPFFFYLEVFPPDLTSFESKRDIALLKKTLTNPIMPLPMRVDRVFNGEQSLLIRPRELIPFSVMDDLNAIINTSKFIQYGVEQLINFTEIRAYEKFFLSLKIQKAKNWWDSTKFLYTKLLDLENDFTAFLKLYIENVLKAKLNNEDLVTAATKYCKSIQKICEKRINENSILIETKRHQSQGKLYVKKIGKYLKKMKRIEKVEIHPELIDLEIYDLSKIGFTNDIEKLDATLESLKPKMLKYIPILFYDDLLECMLQNVKKIDDGDENILDPSFLIDNNIITLHDSKELENLRIHDSSWFTSFEELNLESIIQSISTTIQEFIKKKAESLKKELNPSYSSPPNSSS